MSEETSSITGSPVSKGTAPSMASMNQKPSATFYTATLTEVYPQANLALISGSTGTTKCMFISQIIASCLGLNHTSYPEIGSSVLVLRNTDATADMDYIVGTVPQKSTTNGWDQFSRYVGVSSSSPYAGLSSSNKIANQAKMDGYSSGSAPIDLVEGETLMENSFGVGLALLNNLACLKGSDLAKIECFVLDDLVRILSEQFEHITAFGEYKILNNDGNLNVLWKGTSNEYEAFNAKNKTEKKEGFEEKNVNQLDTDFESDPESTFYLDGRWRFTQYVGKLGNFVHMFLTDPQNILQHEKDSPIQSGRANIHINQDGSLLVQSTSDIVFEKVCRIIVPIEKVRPEEMDFTKLKLDAFAVWKPFDKDNLFVNSYAIKDYSKWFSNYYSLATFIGLPENNIKLASEKEIQAPQLNEGNQDLKSVKGIDQGIFTKYLERYATVRIFRDGSIMLLDGWGDCVHLSGGSVNISAPFDINLSAGNNVNIIGRNINAVAKEEIDLTAVERGMLMKSHAWMESRCNKGPILIQSGMIESEEGDSLPEDPEFKTRVEAAEGNGIILKTDYANLYLDAKFNDILTNAYAAIHKSYYTYFNPLKFNIGNIASFSLVETQFDSATVKLNSLYASTISNATDTPVASTGQRGLTGHHEFGENTPDVKKVNEEIKGLLASDFSKKAMNEEIALQATFKYIPSSDPYMFKPTRIYENITQQLIRTEPTDENELFLAHDPVKWKTKEGYGSSEMGYPMYPGIDKNYTQYNPIISSTSINKACDKAVKDLAAAKLHGEFKETEPTNYFYNPQSQFNG